MQSVQYIDFAHIVHIIYNNKKYSINKCYIHEKVCMKYLYKKVCMKYLYNKSLKYFYLKLF